MTTQTPEPTPAPAPEAPENDSAFQKLLKEKQNWAEKARREAEEKAALSAKLQEIETARLKEKDDQIEKIQEQFALLFAGYAEQASVIENILVTFLSDDSEKEKKFRENLSESRRQFLEMLKEGAEDVLAREDPNLAATLTNVVDKKLSN
jgi:hypothetical protein